VVRAYAIPTELDLNYTYTILVSFGLKMPTLYEYFGIVVKFFSNEHWPIHVHAFYGNEFGCKVEFNLKLIGDKKYCIGRIRGYKMLPHSQLRDLEKLIDTYQFEIIQSWIKFVVLYQRIKKHRITKRIK